MEVGNEAIASSPVGLAAPSTRATPTSTVSGFISIVTAFSWAVCGIHHHAF